MTTWGKRWVLLGFTAVLSVSVTAGCGATTASGADDPSQAGSKKGKREKKKGKRGEDTGVIGDTSSGDMATDVPELPLPEAGVQGEENRSMSAKMNLTLNDESGSAAGLLDKGWSLTEGRRVLIEKVGETAVTQYSILFGERKTSGLDSWSKLPTEGKGYTVVRKGGSLSILDNGKTEASNDERDVVEAEYGFVGKPNPLQLAIKKAEENGEQSLDEPAYRFLLGHVPEIEVDAVTISHEGITESGGRKAHELSVTVVGKIPDGAITYAFEIKGPAVVDETTGWPTQLLLEGELKVSGKVKVKKKELEATGKGSLKMERKATIN